jgi:hypothetical protein
LAAPGYLGPPVQLPTFDRNRDLLLTSIFTTSPISQMPSIQRHEKFTIVFLRSGDIVLEIGDGRRRFPRVRQGYLGRLI